MTYTWNINMYCNSYFRVMTPRHLEYSLRSIFLEET